MLNPLKNTFVSFLSFFRSVVITHLHNSFHALGLYIQSQNVLLARVQPDVDHLRLLRQQAATDPEHSFDAFDEKLFSLIVDSLWSLIQTTAQQ